MSNPYYWVTPQVFLEFCSDVGLHYSCQKCTMEPKQVYIDTGIEEGYLPRSSSYTNTADGLVNMGQSRHIPCVRVTCVHCGHIDLYSLYALDNWRTVKSSKTNNAALGGVFGLGGPSNG